MNEAVHFSTNHEAYDEYEAFESQHMTEKTPITPKTKIHDLLEAYPDLEQALIDAAPQFKKLKNPVLRKTVARVTSLSQAAVIGGIPVGELVNTLRREAGFGEMAEPGNESTEYRYEVPGWHRSNRIVETLDIRQMLEAGEQPLGEVLAAAKRLKKGETLEIIAPFLPAPLIDKAASLEFSHWIDKREEQLVHVYLSR